jgi:phage terminase large subunit
MIMEKIHESIQEPLLNREIIKLWLEKLEQFSKEERVEMLKVIRLLNNPIYITSYPLTEQDK